MNAMETKKKWPGWLVLTGIAVIAAVALAAVNLLTREPIRQRNMAKANSALTALFPEADAFEEMQISEELESAYAVKAGGEIVGYAGTIASQGYAGPVEVIVGLDTDTTLRGISVGGSNFKETEGLGSKTKEPAFTEQFRGKQPPLALGQDIEGVSGATITSSAVVEGTNRAAEILQGRMSGPAQSLTPAAQPSPEPAAPAGRTANASVIGYGGPVLVRLSLDDQGAITALEIGGARMQETAGLGARVAEEAFTGQFIGKTPPLAESDVELIAGATISSKAALEAVNQAAAFLNEPAQ
jgi:RnfABCDGE-type electron transport complex G subunit